MDMTKPQTAIDVAVELIGRSAVARACGVTPPAVKKWQQHGRLPRHALTGERDYAYRIYAATQGRVSVADLLRL
jgi:hypothetical protein